MNELVACVIALLLGGAMAFGLARRLPRRERVWITLGYLAHVLSSTAMVLIVFHYYGDGDMTSYIKWSRRLADLMRLDPGQWIVEYLKMGAHMEFRAPARPPGGHGSTATMYAFTSLHQVVFGTTRFGISLLVAAFSTASKVAVYMVFREHLPERYRARIAVACLLIPSAIFWSASLSKEGVLWMSFGWVLYGFHLTFFRRRRVLGLVMMVAAGYLTALIKAYVLIPMAIGGAVWLYAKSERFQRRRARSPLRTLATAVVVFGAASAFVVGIGEVFPRYELSHFADEAEELQARGRDNAYGSYYTLESSPGFRGKVMAAPLASLTAMYRPLIVEARNPLMFANALETTFFILLSLYILRERGLDTIRVLRSSPALMFCMVYVLLFSIAVGLTSSNLGTLSRYRMPMMPFFGVLFAVLVPLAPARSGGGPRVRPRRRRTGTVVPIHTARLERRGGVGQRTS